MSTTMSNASDGPLSRVEVITSVQRRRRWSTYEKVRLAEEVMQPGMSVSFVARQAGISPSQLFAWKRRMLEGGARCSPGRRGRRRRVARPRSGEASS
jgi:transposase